MSERKGDDLKKIVLICSVFLLMFNPIVSGYEEVDYYPEIGDEFVYKMSFNDGEEMYENK